jgi:hypothetical protein
MSKLKFLFAGVVVMLSACALDEGDDLSADSQDLLNGTPTTARPEVAKFHTPNATFCTATLLSPTTFITAAHCINNAPMQSGGTLEVVNGTILPVVRTFSQGAFGNDNDIAIGLLSSTAPFAAGSISSTEPVPGPLTVVGFGCTQSRDESCFPTNRTFITYNYTGADTHNYAPGDSGGPTFVGSLKAGGPIVRITSGFVTSTNCADIGADPVKYREQLLALSARLPTGTGVAYRSQVQSKGWMDAVNDGTVSGTTGLSLRLEGLQVWPRDRSESICYTAFVQDQGWQTEVCDGQLAGTVGLGKRMEAIKVRVKTGTHGIRYRTYLQDLGWQAWTGDNAVSGTTGQSRRIEAIEIQEYSRVIIPPGGGGCLSCIE